MENLVSIIVPIYNVEQYLEKCIDSIINQTYTNLEIILVNDGSPDNSLKICNFYKEKDSRIKVINKENGGLSDARNVGLENSHGEFILFVDSDDWISSVMVSELVEFITKFNADMVISRYYKVFSNYHIEESSKSAKSVEVLSKTEVMERIMDDNNITNHVWRKLYKKSIIPKDVFPKGKNYEDIYAMPLILENCQKIVNIDKVHYYYRMNNSGIVMSWKTKNLLDAFDLYSFSATFISQKFPELSSKIPNYLLKSYLVLWDNTLKIENNNNEDYFKLKEKLENSISRQSIINILDVKDWRIIYGIFIKLKFPFVFSKFVSKLTNFMKLLKNR